MPFKIVTALVLALAVSGCAGVSERWTRVRGCQAEAGQRPGAGLMLFGVAGALVADAQPEVQAYDARIDACMARTAKTEGVPPL